MHYLNIGANTPEVKCTYVRQFYIFIFTFLAKPKVYFEGTLFAPGRLKLIEANGNNKKRNSDKRKKEESNLRVQLQWRYIKCIYECPTVLKIYFAILLCLM